MKGSHSPFMFVNRESLTSSWLARGLVLFGCIPALFAAWAGGHLNWKAPHKPPGPMPLKTNTSAANTHPDAGLPGTGRLQKWSQGEAARQQGMQAHSLV